jgi:hypothetical protein
LQINIDNIYIFKKLLKICITIGNIDRSKLLPYKSKTNNNFSNKLKLILYFDFNFINLKPKFFEDFKFLISKYKLFDKYSLLPINKMLPNLKLILINNNNINFFSKNFFTTECNTVNCKHCNFVLKTNCIKYNNFHWPLICNCNCQGLFVIYILNALDVIVSILDKHNPSKKDSNSIRETFLHLNLI